MKIKLLQDAYISGYDGALLRYILEDGKESASGISNAWYEAEAVDDKGNTYMVYWELNDDFNPDTDDEEYACDWDNPYMVIDENGKNVLLSKNIEI